MPTEAITGILVPAPAPAPGIGEIRPVLERVASCCIKHLTQGGYFSEMEATSIFSAYHDRLQGNASPQDFILFTAEAQALRHAVTVEGEVQRMQKVLRACLNDRVHYWTFGAMPGRAAGLYEFCPGLRAVCGALSCPAILAGETSIVHVASINPVAALVAAFWIGHEINRQTEGESPFVFPFLTDLNVWSGLMQRHFAA